jgi:preprotein translocase subunit SecG
MKPSSILDIIVIIYYVPAFVLSILVLLKHGRSRQAGWIALTLLSIFRLVGSSAGIAAEYDPSTGALTTSLILSNMGTISLLAALTGIIKRVNTTMTERALPERPLRLTQLPATVALALAIAGGVNSFSSDPSERSEGRTLTRVAIILLLVIYLAAVLLCAYCFVYKRFVLEGERRLLYVSTLSLPFVLVRLVLAFCSAFRSTDPNFSLISTTNTAVIIRALMGILMEFIVVALFIWAGLTVNPTTDRQSRRSQGQQYQLTTVQQESANMKYASQGSGPSYQV